MDMYIVHIKMNLHIEILEYCKNVPTHLIMGLPIIWTIYTTKTTRCHQLQIIMYTMQNRIHEVTTNL